MFFPLNTKTQKFLLSCLLLAFSILYTVRGSSSFGIDKPLDLSIKATRNYEPIDSCQNESSGNSNTIRDPGSANCTAHNSVPTPKRQKLQGEHTEQSPPLFSFEILVQPVDQREFNSRAAHQQMRVQLTNTYTPDIFITFAPISTPAQYLQPETDDHIWNPKGRFKNFRQHTFFAESTFQGQQIICYIAKRLINKFEVLKEEGNHSTESRCCDASITIVYNRTIKLKFIGVNLVHEQTKHEKLSVLENVQKKQILDEDFDQLFLFGLFGEISKYSYKFEMSILHLLSDFYEPPLEENCVNLWVFPAHSEPTIFNEVKRKKQMFLQEYTRLFPKVLIYKKPKRTLTGIGSVEYSRQFYRSEQDIRLSLSGLVSRNDKNRKRQ